MNISRVTIYTGILLCIFALAFAQEARKSETITSLTPAKGFTVANLTDAQGNPARQVLVSCTKGPVNCTESGTTPTAISGTNIGYRLYPGDTRMVIGENNITRFKCIEAVSGNGAVLKAEYYF